ncbi:MAG: ATP-binding protein, partial [Synergistaceae bacterium]|nr:ATP-binding protein [Synergistaceae bacterium]
NAVNRAANVMLATEDGGDFENSLHKGMELMGRCLDVDRVQIWRNEKIDGELYFVYKYEWLSDFGSQTVPIPIDLKFPYSVKPEWERKFLRGEHINGPLSSLPQEDQDFLNHYEIKSIVIIPLFLQNQFWGFFSIDDCRTERTFTVDEIDILRSWSLMMVSAVNRNVQATQLREAHERTKILLDATPLACRLWNRNFEIFDCNEESVKLYGVKDKQEYMARHFELSPEFQPDGQNSIDLTYKILEKVFAEGSYIFEWMYQTLDGTPLPAEITLVRVPYGDDYAVAGYSRDLREHKKFMHEIEKRDYLMNAVNNAAGILLRSEIDDFEGDLHRCMGILAEAVGTDRVTIWKNHTENGMLYYSHVFEWAGSAAITEDKTYTAGAHRNIKEPRCYREKAPSWEDILSGGGCINSLVRDMPPKERAHFSSQGVLSIFVTPVFMGDQFWGFVAYDNYGHERIFTENEQTIMRSGGVVITNALFRNKMMLNIRDASVKLEAALNDAQNANRAKSDFLAKMSHEMRTPLNAVIGLSELTLDSSDLGEEAYSNLKKIYNAGMTLLSTVNDILDISKIEAGRLELAPVEYDVPSLINDAITQSIMRIAEKPIKFVLDIEDDLPAMLYGDDLRVKQILNNLLSNSFKYTKEGSVELSVRCEKDGDEVWMTVRIKDTGIGIRPEDLSNLFTEYIQMESKSNRKIEGTGLGLPITKRLVEMMDGSITAESEYGKGSIFTVKLRQESAGDATIGPDVVRNLKNFSYSDSKRDRNFHMSRVNLSYARVLVVDDVVTNLDVAKGFMKPYGMQIDCVSSGQKAIDAVRDESVRYNAIFMDHMMPGMDGMEATRIIREEIGSEYAKTVPIIALTANAIAGNEEMFLGSGFQAFISKPIEIDRLDAVIRE